MNKLRRINNKLKRSGFRGLLASALRHAADHVDIEPHNNHTKSHASSQKKAAEPCSEPAPEPTPGPCPEQLSHQISAYRVLSRYTSFEGKAILEVGGAQSCDSAYPFLGDGAAKAVVTGIDHIFQEHIDEKKRLNVLRADALKLSSVFGPCSFDVVYGLSVVEHIPSPKLFIEEIYKILKPGGIAYFEGCPIWSSPKGHHLWIATAGGPYHKKATANYLFNEWPGTKSTNPLPDWSHLLMTPEQMREFLTMKAIPGVDIDCIIDWVFHSNQINRANMPEIAEAYTNSMLAVLQANTFRVDVPHDIQVALRKRREKYIDYGICGVSYVLAKL
jgi:SAM-dependent methyltransferase